MSSSIVSCTWSMRSCTASIWLTVVVSCRKPTSRRSTARKWRSRARTSTYCEVTSSLEVETLCTSPSLEKRLIAVSKSSSGTRTTSEA